jgi:dsRNA-specific ribonuclease
VPNCSAVAEASAVIRGVADKIYGGIKLGRGLGKSKKAAESETALVALKKLRGASGTKEG